MRVALVVDGRAVELDDTDGTTLLEGLRDQLGLRSAKDGCSPQGQCGCCTVLVDGRARVACVTPLRRVAGRTITTAAALDDADRWAQAFTAHGASQCGFCTPGIIVRLSALAARSAAPLEPAAVEAALRGHLCRCTGWRTIVDAATSPAPAGDDAVRRDQAGAERRATLEGRAPQRVGPDVALGQGGFADDTAPPGALIAVPDGRSGWAVAESLADARRAANKVQGRRNTAPLTWPLEVPVGTWDLTLRTTWVEPAYLEPDASWCAPGGEPSTPLANGGAFGAKRDSPVAEVARRLADEHGRPVRVLMAREDVVRQGPKRPPIAVGICADGTGIIRVVRTPGIAAAIRSQVPGLAVEEVDVAGPPTSSDIRGAGWAEAAVLHATATGETTITSPDGARATATITSSGIHVTVAAGDPLDEIVLRSYCIGAVHQALGWVTSEAIAVDAPGMPQDLTIRSFGILGAGEMPAVTIDIDPTGDPVNGSDAVFAAVAAAVWRSRGLPPAWPTDHGRTQ